MSAESDGPPGFAICMLLAASVASILPRSGLLDMDTMIMYRDQGRTPTIGLTHYDARRPEQADQFSGGGLCVEALMIQKGFEADLCQGGGGPETIEVVVCGGDPQQRFDADLCQGGGTPFGSVTQDQHAPVAIHIAIAS